MRKRQRDEDKRLEGLQEQLAQTQTANKDLWTTIRGLQRERLDAEQDQRDDLSVLCLFIENVLSPMVFDLTESRDGGGVTHLQAVGAFKCRRPSTINTATTAIHHRCDDGDPAIAFDTHPVGARGDTVLLRLHLAGELDGLMFVPL